MMGYALGTSDLLGQMAAPDYVDKLPVLYLEFAEAARHDPPSGERFAQYKDAADLMRKTPVFWSAYVWPRINEDFGHLFVYLNDPYPNGPNPYLLAVEKNMQRIQERLKSM
jgi:hypothetical protein